MSRTRHAGPVLLLILLIFAANFLALRGIFNDDPAMFLSGLQTGGHRLLPGLPGWYDPTIGFVEQAVGHLAAQDWLAGIVPWWNPYSGAGMPLAAQLQNYAFFLPFVLLLHFHAGWLWLRILLQILTALFTYALLITLRLCRFASLSGGLLAGCMSSFIILAHAPSGTLPFLPLLLLGIERARAAASSGQSMGWSLIPLALAYGFYAGFPETAFLADFLGAAWLLARLPGMAPPAARSMILKCLLAVLIGAGLILPGLIPFASFVKSGNIGSHAGYYATAHLPLASIPLELLPYMFGPLGSVPIGPHPFGSAAPLQSLYFAWGDMGGWIGALPVLLAVLGLFTRLPGLRTLKWTLLGWVVLWQLRSFGAPLTSAILNIIPGIAMIAVQRYAIATIDFCVIVLAAFALDQWRRAIPYTMRQRAAAALVILALAAISLWIGWPILLTLTAEFAFFKVFSLAYLCFVAIILMTLFAWLRQPPTSVARAVIAFLVLVSTILGYVIPQSAGATAGRLDIFGTAYLQSHLGINRVYAIGPLEPNYGSEYGIAEIDHNGLPIPQNWTIYIAQNLDPGTDPIVFNGHYELRPQNVPTEAAELRLHLANYQAIGVKYVLTFPAKNPFTGLANPPPKVFGNNVMDIYQIPKPAPYFSAAGAACNLTIETRQSLAADCHAPATLTRQELFYPGWHAVVNGAVETVSQSGQIFQSIPLPAGHSQINFWYRPTHIRLACAIALAAAAVWAACGIRARRRVTL